MGRRCASLGRLGILFLVLGLVCGCATPSGTEGPDADAPGEGVAAAEASGPRTLSVKPGSLKMRPPRPHGTFGANPAPVPHEGDPIVSRPGDGSSTSDAYRLKEGDPLFIILRDIPQAGTYEEIVDENGDISLPYINELKVVGYTAAELEKVIREQYVPGYYRYLGVTVVMPTQRSYFLRGEIRGPGRYQYLAGVTLMQAISTAGGFSDFANKKKVQILRGNDKLRYNIETIEKNPDTDVPLEPGDNIIVPRTIW